MEDNLELPVTYRGEEYLFPIRFIAAGYIHKMEVNVNGQTVQFESDESQNYRALVDQEQINNFKIDIGLLEAIAKVIESIRS